MAGGIHVGHVGEPHPETAVGHGVEDEIQRVLAEQVALVGAVALAVCDQLQLVLTGERRLLDLLGGEIETNWRKAAGLQPKDAAGPQLDLNAASVGGCAVPQCCGMVLALCAAIVKQSAQVAFESQGERRMIAEQGALCAHTSGGT